MLQPLVMDDFAFDFERGLEQNVGQPVEPPPSMPASGRKNYRMVRGRVRNCRDDDPLAHVQHADCVPPLAARALHERERVRLSASVRGVAHARLPLLRQV